MTCFRVSYGETPREGTLKFLLGTLVLFVIRNTEAESINSQHFEYESA